MNQSLEGAGQPRQGCTPQSDHVDTQEVERLPSQPQNPQNDFPPPVDQPPAYSSALFKGQSLTEKSTALTRENEEREHSRASSTNSPEQEWTSQPLPRPYSSAVEQAADLDYQRYVAQHDDHPTFIPSSLSEETANTSRDSSTLYLPSYGENCPPKYTRKPTTDDLREPKTLGRLLFIMGFFFPGFWLAGAVMLVIRTRSAPLLWKCQSRIIGDPELGAWYEENMKTEEDRQKFLVHIQLVGRKWEKSCLLALGCFVCLSGTVGMIVYALMKVQ